MEEKALNPLNPVSCLGHGSFGLVLKVDNGDETFSAVKIIYQDMVDETLLSRECNLLKGKVHKNIVQLLDIFEHPFGIHDIEKLTEMVEDSSAKDQLFIIRSRIKRSKEPAIAVCLKMELCGEMLRTWLNRWSNQSTETNFEELNREKMCIIRDITKGLWFLHENKILHRDLKPENIMFSPNQEVWKIGDFGISRIIHLKPESKTSSLTKERGTKDYRAPEMDSEEYDFRSDLFSLGLVIWEVAQLIPEKEKRTMFYRLVHNENLNFVITKLTPSIARTIVHLTKRKISDRMGKITGLETFISEIEAKMPRLAKNSIELLQLLEKCNAGDIILLEEGAYDGEFIISKNGISIKGKSPEKTRLVRSKADKDSRILTIISNNCNISNLSFNISRDQNGVEIEGYGNSVSDVNFNGGYTPLSVNGKGNKFCNLEFQDSKYGMWFEKSGYWLEWFENGNEVRGAKFKNISNIGIGIENDYNLVVNASFENVGRGIHVNGNKNKMNDVTYTLNIPVESYFYGIKIRGNKNKVNNFAVKLGSNSMQIGRIESGLHISKNSNRCVVRDSVCGPLLIEGNEHTLTNVKCGNKLEIDGNGHALINCKGNYLKQKNNATFTTKNCSFGSQHKMLPFYRKN